MTGLLNVKAVNDVNGYAHIYLNVRLEPISWKGETVRVNRSEVNMVLNYWLLRYVLRNFDDERKVNCKVAREVMLEKFAVLHLLICN